VLEPLRIGEDQRVPVLGTLGLHPTPAKPLGPEVERLRRGDPPDDPVDHPIAGAPGGDARVLEEGQVRAWVALLVRVEQVVHVRAVLVDRLLHQAQSEDADVEVDIALPVLGDRGDVVDTVELHALTISRCRGGQRGSTSLYGSRRLRAVPSPLGPNSSKGE
jgi:hypothetical protein